MLSRLMSAASTIDDVIQFWFEELGPRDWYRVDADVDIGIVTRFGDLYEELKDGVPEFWLDAPHGYLAAIIVLDQFPRNMFRGDEKSFATDALALSLAKRAIDEGADRKLPPPERAFIYLPFQHAEDATDQAQSVALFTALGNPLNLDFALRHQAVIDRFGRFPHRNDVLARSSTPEEREFLATSATPF